MKVKAKASAERIFEARRFVKPRNMTALGKSIEAVKITKGSMRGQICVVAWGWEPADTNWGRVRIEGLNGLPAVVGWQVL